MVLLLAIAGPGLAGDVAGAVKVSGTKLKTAGSKSQKHVVVYLEKTTGDYPAPPATHPSMDQQGLVFVPHVMAVQKGTTVDFLNNDQVEHNIFCVDDCCKILEGGPGKKGDMMDLGNWGKGEVRHYTFNIAGVAVLLCKLHPEMAAYMVVVDSPWFTIAEIDAESQSATYRIKDVPPGTYMLKTWNKKTESAPVEITVTDAAVTTDLQLTKKKRHSKKHHRK